MFDFEPKISTQKLEFEFQTILENPSGDRLPDYTGNYEVIPKVKLQKLNTKNKSMLKDVTISEIPTEETHNQHGTTFTIGGIL